MIMKRTRLVVSILIVSGIFLALTASADMNADQAADRRILLAQSGNPTFAEVVDNLDVGIQTRYHVREYMRSIKGMEVVWSGNVVDVIGGRNRIKIHLADSSRGTYQGFNIVCTSYTSMYEASGLRRGDYVQVRGYIRGYKRIKYGSGVIMYLDDVVLQ
jgi:hypothetical protein